MSTLFDSQQIEAEKNLNAKIEAVFEQKMQAYEQLLERQAQEIQHLKATVHTTQNTKNSTEALPTSRRKMLKRLAVVAGATVAATALTANPQSASAATGGNLIIGQSNNPTAVADVTQLAAPVSANLMPIVFYANNFTPGGTGGATIPTDSRIAIIGRTVGNDASAPAGGVTRIGVWGAANQQGYGIWGQSVDGIGVYGTDTTGVGVRGISDTIGVWGTSNAPTFNANNVGVLGASTNSIGVLANSTNSYSLWVDSTTNTGAPIFIEGSVTANSGAPTSGLHQAGELWRGNGTRDGLYYCIVSGTPGLWVQLAGSGSIGNLHFLATPFRVAATVNAGGTNPLLVAVGANPGNGNSSSALITVAGAAGSGIPTTARGVVGSLTNVGSTSGGNLRVWAGGGNVPTVNNLNIPGNLGAFPNLTTAFNAGLNPAGQLTIGYGTGTVGATTGYNIDISGYFE